MADAELFLRNLKKNSKIPAPKTKEADVTQLSKLDDLEKVTKNVTVLPGGTFLTDIPPDCLACGPKNFCDRCEHGLKEPLEYYGLIHKGCRWLSLDDLHCCHDVKNIRSIFSIERCPEGRGQKPKYRLPTKLLPKRI